MSWAYRLEERIFAINLNEFQKLTRMEAILRY